ncbi:MAG TPA: hypothetical protein VER11_35260 [Polyangiaceae bacterium]|nr:hypothetical protein [Polyangiaceae bacterium]
MGHRPLPATRNSLSVRRRLSWAVLTAAFVVGWQSPAFAYSWMIGHGYSQCAQCHVDPSGAGALTQYGRGISESLLRTHYGFERRDDDSKLGQFLFGLVPLPDELDFGGSIRALSLSDKVEGAALEQRLIWMQLDARASLRSGRFVGSASIGYAPEGALGAAITGNTEHNLVSREHWLGVWLGASENVLLRAGRMNLPFGVRSIEHTLWARNSTGTNINDQQQYGLTVSYADERFRGELMGIIGSFQIRPDEFRQRGYSAFAEYAVLPTLTFGASSKIVHLEIDPKNLVEEWRHAHGLFGRWSSPWKPLVMLGELDYVLESPKDMYKTRGVVGYLQADVEATQGLHFMGTFEGSGVTVSSAPTSFGGWLSYAWFFAPHADIRLDNIYRSIGTTAGHVSELSFLMQGHFSL